MAFRLNQQIFERTFLEPANEVCEGYVFTGVCLSTGECLPHFMLGHPPGRHPPAQCMLGYGQQAGGTHPTGMHSCLVTDRGAGDDPTIFDQFSQKTE